MVAGIAAGAAFYFDSTVRDFVAQHQNRLLHKIMGGVSRWGDWLPHMALGLVLLAVAWWRGRKEWMRIFFAMLIALALAGVAARAIKIVTARPRPSVKTEQVASRSHFSSKYHAFPSGHATASMAFFGVLLFARRPIGVACLPIPVFIGFARIYLQAHYLSDVVCGIVLGLLCAILVARLLRIRNPQSEIRN